MIGIIFLSILFIAYLFFGITDLFTKFESKELIKFIAGIIPFLYSLFSLVLKVNLKIYFWWTRVINRIKNPTTKWNIVVSFEGNFVQDLIDKFENKLIDKNFINADVKIMHRNNQSLNFVIDETLNLYLDYENSKFVNKTKDIVNICFPTFEISCNNSEKKLNEEIVPLLEKFKDYFKPDSSSYTLNIDFMGKNPFYSVFIDHIRLEQIDDFNVNLHFDKYSLDNRKDRVTIKKDEIHIISVALNNFKELAKDFIFLSPDLAKMLKCKEGE